MKTTARDIMSTELITAKDDSTIEEGVKLLVNNRITGLPVVNKTGKLVGVLSEYDILNQLSKLESMGTKAFRQKVEFSKSVEAIDEKTSLEKILSMMVNAKFRRLPVTNSKGQLVGIITRRDLIRLFYYRARLT